MCGVYPDADVKSAGEQISSTYEGRHVTLYASELTHAGSVVTKGLPVVFGEAVGIAFTTEVAGTDLIAVDTEGIWTVDVLAENDDGAIAVAHGDRLFIHRTTCVVSKISAPETHIPFGIAYGAVDTGTKSIAVKIHGDPAPTVALQRSTAHIMGLQNQDDIGWTDLDLDTVITVPVGAIGILLETYVYETNARPTLLLRKKGDDTNDWQWIRNSVQVSAIAHEAMAVVEMDNDHIIQYRLQSTAGATSAAFSLKLLGWIMRS